MKRITVLFLFITFFSGCSSSLQNLSTEKNKISYFYETGEFSKELQEVVNEALVDINRIRVNYDSMAVVFDIDETVLSNYEHIKSVNFGYVSKLWSDWVMEAKAPAIPEVKQLYDRIISKGMRVIFITGRKENEYDATYKNLINEGYTKFDTLIVRNSKMSHAPAANFKRIERAVLTGLGYTIVACVGDQWSDLTGENTGIKIKIPNYLYIIE